eukprot:scaffold7352_cov254-Pinguiococcus_pyrenoidosus.AAC.24
MEERPVGRGRRRRILPRTPVSRVVAKPDVAPLGHELRGHEAIHNPVLGHDLLVPERPALLGGAMLDCPRSQGLSGGSRMAHHVRDRRPSARVDHSRESMLLQLLSPHLQPLRPRPRTSPLVSQETPHAPEAQRAPS